MSQGEYGEFVFEVVERRLDLLQRFSRFIATIPTSPGLETEDAQTVAEIFGFIAEKSQEEIKKVSDFVGRNLGDPVVIRATYDNPEHPPMTMLRAELNTARVVGSPERSVPEANGSCRKPNREG